MDLFQGSELIYLSLLTVGCFYILGRNIFSKNYYQFWSPMTFIALVYIYYTILGPLIALINHNTVYRLIQHRPYFETGWIAATLSFSAILLGFTVSKTYSQTSRLNITSEEILQNAKGLFWIGLFGLTITVGTSGLISKIDFTSGGGGGGGYRGAFMNYFNYMINFFISATGLALIYGIQKRKFFWPILILAVAASIYMNEGFRYRLVLLSITALGTYHLFLHKRINLVYLFGGGIAFIILMGVIGSTRNYMNGLNLDNLEGKTQSDLFLEGFGEAAIFESTSLLLNIVPERLDYIGSDPIVHTLVFPIPRSIWPDKPSGEYLDKINGAMYGSASLGAATMNYGEYYAAFGWTGLLIGCFLIGFFYKKLWGWFLVNRSNPYAIVLYCVAVSYCYVIISRGYLPQITMLFFFTVMPVYFIYKRARRKLQ